MESGWAAEIADAGVQIWQPSEQGTRQGSAHGPLIEPAPSLRTWSLFPNLTTSYSLSDILVFRVSSWCYYRLASLRKKAI